LSFSFPRKLLRGNKDNFWYKKTKGTTFLTTFGRKKEITINYLKSQIRTSTEETFKGGHDDENRLQ
jgi:hypothetical protein